MINPILRFIGLFSRMWVRLGVNPDHLDAILRVKLTMDDRRPSAFNRSTQQRKTKKEIRNVSWVTVLLSGIMGGFYLYFLADVGTDDVSGLTLFFIMFMLMLAITLVADFSYVLIDVKDNYIILPKPVSPQTVLMSRLLHILIHLSKLVVPMAIPGLVYMCIHAGAGGALAYVLDVLLATLLCIFLINAAYLVILRFTSAERFKDIIGAVQIVFSVVLIMLYLVVPHTIGTIHVDAAFFLNKPYLYWLPPLWLAALWDVLRHPVGQTGLLWGLGVAGLVLSPLSMWVVIRFLAPSFNRRLSRLVGGSGEVKSVPGNGTPKPRSGKTPGYLILSRWLTRGSKEATGFEIAWLLTGRYRDFKMKVYPSFAYVLVYFVYFILIGDKGKPFVEKWHDLPSGRMYILLIYSSSLAMISAIGNMVYSEKYKAAWVYYSSPVEAPGQILTGAVKAMVVKYFVPFYVVICALALSIWGAGVLPDLLLGFINILFFGGLLGLLSFRKMPFSAEVNVAQGSGRFMKGLFTLLIPGVVGTAHYLVRRLLPDFQPLIWVFVVLSGILAWMVYSKYRELSWSELDWS